MEALNIIKPTSKASLKQASLFLSNLDIDKAERMYEFLVKDMKDLPDVEPESKPTLSNIKEQAGSIFGWIRENEDVLTKGVSIIRGIIGKKAPAAAPLPPINP